MLAFVLMYDMRHYNALVLILHEYRGMCEIGFDPVVVIQTTAVDFQRPDVYESLVKSSFCYRTGSPIKIRIQLEDKASGIYLSEAHRKYLSQEKDNFDVFIYQEDDVLFQPSHLVAYLNETQRLRSLDKNNLKHFMLGFQRYQSSLRAFTGKDAGEVLKNEHYLEHPFFEPVCVQGHPYTSVVANPHQAMWILTREQVSILADKCSFFNQTIQRTEHHRYVREYMSSLSIFQNNVLPRAVANCNMTKLIPPERLASFSIKHLFRSGDPYFSSDVTKTHPMQITIRNINAGYAQFAQPLLRVDYYQRQDKKCWAEIFDRNQRQLSNQSDEVIFIRKQFQNSVYLFQNGTKRIVRDVNAIKRLGYKMSKIYDVPIGEVVELIPSGPDL